MASMLHTGLSFFVFLVVMGMMWLLADFIIETVLVLVPPVWSDAEIAAAAGVSLGENGRLSSDDRDKGLADLREKDPYKTHWHDQRAELQALVRLVIPLSFAAMFAFAILKILINASYRGSD